MTKINAYIEKGNDGRYSVYVDDNDTSLNYGIHGEGTTIEEVVSDFKQSYIDMKKFHKKNGYFL